MIKALFFDLDGTLLDTLEDIRICLNATLEAFGYPPLTLAQTRAYVGNGARRLVERALPEHSRIEEVYSAYRSAFASAAGTNTKLFDGERDVLLRLKERYAMCVISNKPQDATENVVREKLGFVSFDFIGGDSGAFPVKPDPALTLFAVGKLGVRPDECLFIGDGETDVQTGHGAGMATVSCLWGNRTREQLQAAGATLFAADFAELESLIDQTDRNSAL